MKKSVEKVFPRHDSPHMVGDGFRVYNLIPGAGITRRRMSPFLMLDFNAEVNIPPSDKVHGVGPHPHKGFETVTIAYKGSVAHNDSRGNSGVIHAGDVQWMTAGNGILHKEYHDEEFSRKGGPFEMVQLWVNLPAKDKSTPAHYQAITSDRMGKVILPNQSGTVDVIAGKFQNVEGPADTYTPVNLFNVRLEKQGETTFNIPAGHNTALLVVNGCIEVNGESAKEHHFVLFRNDGEEITIKAKEKSVVLFMSGEPIDEPIATYGPFVMNTQEEIVEAVKGFQAGKYGELD